MKTLQEYLKQATEGYAVSLTADQLKQFDTYYQLLTEWNQKINLTAITDPEGVAVKHFADSLAFFNYCDIPGGGSVIDIGTGAGFPGIVLKIVRPDIQLTLGRAEAYGQNLNYRESYDVAVSRAVAQLNTLSEYCLPFVRLSGRFVAFKGGNSDEEICSAKHAIQTLGGKLEAVHSFSLPMDGGSRSLVEIEKVQPTSEKYPRNNGRIKAKPL